MLVDMPEVVELVDGGARWVVLLALPLSDPGHVTSRPYLSFSSPAFPRERPPRTSPPPSLPWKSPMAGLVLPSRIFVQLRAPLPDPEAALARSM